MPVPVPTKFFATYKNQSTASLEWYEPRSVTGERTYIIEQSDDRGQTWQARQLDGAGTYFGKANKLTSGKTYQWRISMKMAEGTSPTSDPIELTLLPGEKSKVVPAVILTPAPITPSPVNVKLPEPPTLLEAYAETPLHFNCLRYVKAEGKIPCKSVLWTVTNPNGDVWQATIEAFNIGLLPSLIGKYVVTYVVTFMDDSKAIETFEVNVKAKAWNVVIDPSDLFAAINASKSDTKIVITKDVELKNPDSLLKGYLSVENNAKIIFTGPSYTQGTDPKRKPEDQQWSRSIFTLDDGAVLDGVTLDVKSYEFTPETPGRMANFVTFKGNNAVVNCTVDNVSHFTNTENRPDRVIIANNKCGPRLARYFIWLDASNAFVYGNEVSDSVVEHIVRGGSYYFASIVNNRFSNVAKAYWDKNIIKSVVSLQGHEDPKMGAFGYVYGNKVSSGTISLGPLGTGYVPTAGQRSKYIVVRKNEVADLKDNASRFELHHGLEHFYFSENTGAVVATPVYAAVPEEVRRTVLDGVVELTKGQPFSISAPKPFPSKLDPSVVVKIQS